MSDQLPAPLTPADCDLRGLSFMPLDAQRLLDSDLFAIATGDEFKAAVALWCKSWFQVPAASLPNDDRILAHLSGAGSGWKKVRDVALRNWILCEDGRLYHPIVAEKALEAWPARIGYQTKKSADAERKERERQDRKALFETLRSHGQVMPYDTPTKTLRALASQLESQPVTPPVTEPVTPLVTDSHGQVTAKTGTGTGTGTGTVKPKTPEAARIGASPIAAPAETVRAAPLPPPNPEDSPTRRGAVAVVLRDLGVTCTYAHPTVCDWASKGVTDEQIREAVQVARMRKPLPEPIPIAYLVPIVRELHDRPVDAGGSRERDWAYIFGETDTRATA